MSHVTPNYPASVWDGTTANRNSRDQNKKPDYRDWDQLSAEVIAIQEGAPIGGTGGSGGSGGIEAVNVINPIIRTVLTLTDVSIATVDAGAAGAHGSHVAFTFPEGNILILGATTDLAIVAGAGGLTDTSAVVAAVGSVATVNDNATLTSTEANIVPSTAATLTDGAGVADGQSTAPVTLDGTAGAAVARLNVATVDAGSTADDTLTVNGTITLIWTNLGDN